MNTKPVLVLSLLLNLALVLVLAWGLLNKPVRTEAVSPAVQASETASEAKPPSESSGAAMPAIAPTPSAQAFDWRLVESEDYKKYIANLRAIGCPEETIRDIIIADVNKLFESRKRTLRGAATNRFEYWKTGNVFAGFMDPERIEQEQALAREKRELLTELLGVAPEEKPNLLAAFNPFESLLDFLPDGKQTAVLELYQKYQAKMLKGFSGGTPDADDLKQMQKTQRELESELAAMLTPQEFEDYQLRMSQTAMTMRMQLASFDPNEQEFRDIFQLKKAFDDEFGMFGLNLTDAAEQSRREAATQELNGRLKTLLGEARYAEYERSQDYVYQGLHRVAEKHELGKEAAVKVYDMKKVAEEQARNVRRNTTLTRDQRDGALRDIRAETENSIRAVFGEQAFRSYQNQPGAFWLKGLSPDPPPQTP